MNTDILTPVFESPYRSRAAIRVEEILAHPLLKIDALVPSLIGFVPERLRIEERQIDGSMADTRISVSYRDRDVEVFNLVAEIPYGTVFVFLEKPVLTVRDFIPQFDDDNIIERTEVLYLIGMQHNILFLFRKNRDTQYTSVEFPAGTVFVAGERLV
jgi:hypothetical protein